MAEKSGSGRPQVGLKSGGCRGDEIAENLHHDGVSSNLPEKGLQKHYVGREETARSYMPLGHSNSLPSLAASADEGAL